MIDHLLIWLASLAVAALIALTFPNKRDHAARARALNCGSPVTLSPGINGAISIIKEVQYGRIIEYIASLQEIHRPTLKGLMIGIK